MGARWNGVGVLDRDEGSTVEVDVEVLANPGLRTLGINSRRKRVLCRWDSLKGDLEGSIGQLVLRRG